MTNMDQSLSRDLEQLIPTIEGQESLHRSSRQPRGEIEAELVHIWQDLLEQEQIGVNDDFFDLGGDSILGTRLMSAIHDKFHQRFELSRLFTYPTIEALAGELLAAKQASDVPQTTHRTAPIHIVPMHPEGTKTPLFCMHCATGHVLRYRAMVSRLDSDVPVYGLRAPEIHELTKFPTVEELAELYVKDIRQLQPQGPYQVCGFSFGGLVALEVARRLQSTGEPVSLVALLDSVNPAHYQSLSFLQTLRMRSTYLRDRVSTYGRNAIFGKWKQLYTDVAEFFWWRAKELAWKLRKTSSTLPKVMGASAVKETVVMFATAGESFKPKPYPGRIVLIRSAKRPRFADEEALGWEGVAQDGVEVCTVPGDHFSVIEEPDVAGLANALNVLMTGHAPQN